ncbi:hypothetical protein [[Eubacterium] cellulosolvens]
MVAPIPIFVLCPISTIPAIVTPGAIVEKSPIFVSCPIDDAPLT